MHARYLFPTTLAAVACLLIAAAGGSGNSPAQPQAQLELLQLQIDFHGAATLGDYELMHNLWADDAVVNAGGNKYFGPDDIADFFSSSPNWGEAASLAPTYKTNYEIRGNTATLQFECVLVNTGGHDPLTTPLSEIPFGSQNPDVEIVQHSTATCTAVRQGGRWVLKTFDGSAGPMP